jgi:hypothetical protein
VPHVHVIYPAWLHFDDDDDGNFDGCERLTWVVVVIVLMLLLTHLGASTGRELLFATCAFVVLCFSSFFLFSFKVSFFLF